MLRPRFLSHLSRVAVQFAAQFVSDFHSPAPIHSGKVARNLERREYSQHRCASVMTSQVPVVIKSGCQFSELMQCMTNEVADNVPLISRGKNLDKVPGSEYCCFGTRILRPSNSTG